MARAFFLASLLLVANVVPSYAVYNVARDYSGDNFFTLFDYYGNIDGSDATQQQLAYVSQHGTAIVKVDNSSNVVAGSKRNSIRLTSKDAYPVGSLWIIDATHIPYGCSVWPAVWTTGEPWPNYGEIDIIEGVNEMTANQQVIHTRPGCTKTTPLTQTSRSGPSSDCSSASGCVVSETQPNSYGAAFATAGGGVFAAQFDVSGIFMWFWSRPNVPASITQAASDSSIDISTWGNPSAAYPSSSCNIQEYFGPQKIVIDITLCGVWAGVNSTYHATCPSAGPKGVCNVNNVIGPGSPQYDEAYFEFNYIRGYTMDGVSIYSSGAQNYSSPGAPTTVEAVSYQTELATTSTAPATPSKKSAGMLRSTMSAAGLIAGITLATFGVAWI